MPRKPFKPLKQDYSFRRDSEWDKVKSENTGKCNTFAGSRRERYEDPELQAREDAARAELAEKEKQVVILCPKSTYQLCTSAALLKDIGKKTSQLD